MEKIVEKKKYVRRVVPKDHITVNWKILLLEIILGAIFFISVGIFAGVRYIEHFINITP